MKTDISDTVERFDEERHQGDSKGSEENYCELRDQIKELKEKLFHLEKKVRYGRNEQKIDKSRGFSSLDLQEVKNNFFKYL